MPYPKTLLGAYPSDAEWILKNREKRQKRVKGERKTENTCDVIHRLVAYYKNAHGEAS